MRTDGQRRSNNVEDRGTGRRGGGGGGVPVQALLGLVRVLGWKGSIVVAVVLGIGYFLMPDSIRSALFGGTPQGATGGGGSACAANPTNAAACDFSSVVLASTEDVWSVELPAGRVPGSRPMAYANPTLVVFSTAVSTGGCGNATSEVGPFYCPADQRLYIDPGFYQVMETQLRAPGDFAQAYVIAHEIGHHIQRLIQIPRSMPGETDNQVSVRVELQADCLAGVWGHKARASLEITEADLAEALGAAHAIGDDTLGHDDRRAFTHGSSEQRMRWFRRGFDSGDGRQCDTFAVPQSAL
jgi:predicted metalloprotease